MAQSPLLPEAAQWLEGLRAFVALERTAPLPDRDALSPRQDWQRRITGGVVVQFFEFLENKADETLFPILAKHPLHERAFVLVTDEPGYLAVAELMDLESPMAICVLKQEWRRFVEDEGNDDDEAYRLHYQFWSVWHRNVPAKWNKPVEGGGELWVHEEGFALADGAGRGAQHLWLWDGEEMKLVEETMTSWVS